MHPTPVSLERVKPSTLFYTPTHITMGCFALNALGLGLCFVITLPGRTVVPNSKIPPKIKLENSCDLTEHTNASKSVTNFQYEADAFTGNGNDKNML